MIGAVDIGGSKIAVGAVDSDARILAHVEWPTAALLPVDSVRRIGEEFLLFAERTSEPVHGIGVGCTGPVDPLSGKVGNVDLLPGWEGLDLVDHLADQCGVSVAVENDADAAALAEAEWGAGKGASRFIYVTVSTGIGTGMVFDGQLYRGADAAHPEAGHHGLDPSGPRCYCGTDGCWESLASGPAMARWMASEGRNAISSVPLTAREVCRLAREGNELALRAVDREAHYLGVGLANLVTIFCPDVIALGGGVMESWDLFLGRASEVISRRCGLVPWRRTSIRRAALGPEAPLLGAAAVWLSRFSRSELTTGASGTERY